MLRALCCSGPVARTVDRRCFRGCLLSTGELIEKKNVVPLPSSDSAMRPPWEGVVRRQIRSTPGSDTPSAVCNRLNGAKTAEPQLKPIQLSRTEMIIGVTLSSALICTLGA